MKIDKKTLSGHNTLLLSIDHQDRMAYFFDK